MKYRPLSIISLIAITVLSLFPVKELHLENMTLSDKWAHFIMYGGFTTAMFLDHNYKNFKKRTVTLPLFIVVLPIFVGCLMEVLQAYCTNGNRSGDWLDAVANSIGAILAYSLAFIYAKLTNKQAPNP